jgi:hypothetical protein
VEVAVTTLEQGDAGTIELSPAVFGQPVRADVLPVPWFEPSARYFHSAPVSTTAVNSPALRMRWISPPSVTK